MSTHHLRDTTDVALNSRDHQADIIHAAKDYGASIRQLSKLTENWDRYMTLLATSTSTTMVKNQMTMNKENAMVKKGLSLHSVHTLHTWHQAEVLDIKRYQNMKIKIVTSLS